MVRVCSYVVLLLSIGTLISCTDQSGPTTSPLNRLGQPIIASEFQDPELRFEDGVPKFMVLLKLHTPAALSEPTQVDNGTRQVNAQLLAQIEAEQEQKIQELMAISPDIRVLYRYKMVLNALAIEAPQAVADAINTMDVDLVEAVERFSSPKPFENMGRQLTRSLSEKVNSMSYIGVDRIHRELTVTNSDGQAEPVLGQGVKVGIIDSGIDYTHAMLGGPGEPLLYQSIDANQPHDAFPNAKVVGGFDFAGDRFFPGSHIYGERLPKPDPNPLDREGHGTHVAGTVAGLGDGVNTYDGAAPGASLYALKVFGDAGAAGTMDSVVIAALEYAADPNQDGKLDDRLDVVNMSLGGNFGAPQNMYSEAIRNLTQGGVVVVAAAGNSGAIRNVVGAPSTADEALSVAASIDGSPHIWQFPAVKILGEGLTALEEAVEGQSTRPLSQVSNLVGELAYIGLAAADLTIEQAQSVSGKVALIERGQVSFDEKIARAQAAGAIAVVMINNEAGRPFIMAGEVPFQIPGVMITQLLGQQIKAKLLNKEVVQIDFKPSEKVEIPEIVDTIAPFSSQGPRDLDAKIKPEVSAPGYAIISAQAGTGNLGVDLYGTSMAAPHVAGIAALAVQYRRDLSALQIKSLLMNSGKNLVDPQGQPYAVSRQGAGRLQAFAALTAPVVVLTPAVSLGKVPVNGMTNRQEVIRLQNISATTQNVSLSTQVQNDMSLSVSPAQVEMKPGEIVEVQLTASFTTPSVEIVELDGFVEIQGAGGFVGRIPVMAVINRTTGLTLEGLAATGIENQVVVDLANYSEVGGPALLFNHLGKDPRKPNGGVGLSVACDLESAGYRIVEKENAPFLQVALKLYNPVTTWGSCDINLEFDMDQDGLADKELWGTRPGGLPGLAGAPLPQFASILMNSAKLREIYTAYFAEIEQQNPEPPGVTFAPAVEMVRPMLAITHSTVAMVEVPLSALGAATFNLKVAATYNGGDVVEGTDALDVPGGWTSVSANANDQAFVGLPEVIQVTGQGKQSVTVQRGLGAKAELVAYFPRNEFIMETLGLDSQAQTETLGALTPSFAQNP